MGSNDPFEAVLDDLAQYLDYAVTEGEAVLELPPDLADFPRGKRAVPPPAAVPETTPGLAAIARAVSACTLCRLHEGRTRTVPGQGASNPEIMFVGEAPGEEEDRSGLAFVGAAGQLLTQMIAAMGYTREAVFIGNIVKCRPPGNRKPQPDEMAACMPYLKRQIALLKPTVIVALGAVAVKGLFDPKETITKFRGKWQTFEGIPVMPTFHPAYLLRYPTAKKDAWDDLRAVLRRLGRTPPPVRRAP